MDASSIPTKFPIPFANSSGAGYIRQVPTASQIGIQNGAASLTDGFPPLNFLATGSGGVPPFGQDHNGILNQATAWLRWMQAGGGIIPYDATFQTAISGYPNGALVASTTTAGLVWRSTADNNTTDPDTGGAGWAAFGPPHGFAAITSSGTFTVPAGVFLLRRVTAIGGGGGGGGASASANGYGSAGGGGGGTTVGIYTVTPGAVITVTIGAGGSGGGAGANGTTGGTTSFGSFCSATGGSGGTFQTGAFGIVAGGIGSGGTINYKGQSGGAPISIPTSQVYGGCGGAAVLGGAQAWGVEGTPEGGHSPGGGGAAGGGIAGAAGAAGAVMVEW